MSDLNMLIASIVLFWIILDFKDIKLFTKTSSFQSSGEKKE